MATIQHYFDTYAAAKTFLNGKKERAYPSIRETTIRDDGNSIAVRYRGTSVVRYYPNGDIEITSGGWQTDTTKRRINAFSPIRVYQQDYAWYFTLGGVPYHFRDGLVLLADGETNATRAA